MVQNDKKLCTSCSISQETYIIWLPFMVQICKMIISPGAFLMFSVFSFSGSIAGKRTKNDPNWQKLLSVRLNISRTIHHMIAIYGAQCKMIISLGIFFIFLKLWLTGSLGGLKIKKWPKKTKKTGCLTLYLRNRTSYDCDFWYTYVNDDVSRCLFLIFKKFWFFGSLGG